MVAVAAAGLMVGAGALPAAGQSAEQAWPQRDGDPQASGRAIAEGPTDPGLKWHARYDQISTDDAPAGYSGLWLSNLRALISSNNTLIMEADNEDPQYANRARFGRELVGIDGDTGEVVYEIPYHSPRSQSRCAPALDSHDRVWTETRRAGDDWYFDAFDADTGERVERLDLDERACREAVLVGGEGELERLIFATGDDPRFLTMLDVSDADGAELVSTGLGLSDAASLANHGGVDSWGVFSDDRFYTLVELEDGTLELVAVDLADGEAVDRLELPTSDDQSSGDYVRALLTIDADEDMLLVAPRSARADDPEATLAGVSIDGDMELAWQVGLREEPQDLQLGDGVAVIQEGTRTTLGAWPLTAFDTATGTVVYDDGVAGGSRPLLDASGSGYTSSRDGDMTRDRLITRFGPDGQLQWLIRPNAVVEAAGVGERDGLGLGAMARLQLMAVGADGTLFVSNERSPGLLAIDGSGGLAEFPVPFEDVDQDDVHAPNIRRLAEAEITGGDADGNYRPGEDVSRAQMATFLVRAIDGLEAIPGDAFVDVDPENVHAPSINAVAEAEITAGVGGDRFDPNGPVTRAQMATFLVRAIDGLEAIPGDAFVDVDPENVHAPSINAVAEAEISEGIGGDRYDPDGTVTRAQMASFLVRAFLS